MINDLIEMTNKGPYEIGREIIVHRSKSIDTTLNSKSWEQFAQDVHLKKYKIVKIGPGVAHRPDLISNQYYGSPLLFWLILLANGLSDPFEGLNSGDLIRIVNI